MKAFATRTWLGGVVAGMAVAAVAMIAAGPQDAASADKPKGQTMMLAHNVFFTLRESNEKNRRKLVDACNKYLSDHPGTVFYAAGTVSDLDREVNDRDFDVGLHIIFKDRAAHDTYQDAAKHQQFIQENKADWAKVRVFDSDVTSPKK
ncbi:MAG TPA: Dabb family protein [Pirellulales bacterium]|nr:Dabb family protein [Pirellulales bacterium]